MYIFQVISKSFSLFDQRQRFHFLLLLIFFLFSAAIQIAGVASIGPFVAILSNPDVIHSNKLLSYFYALGKFSNNTQFIIAFATVSLIMTLVSNAIAILTLWLLMRFSIGFGATLQSRLFLNFVGRPYAYHKSNNYTKSIATIAQEAPRFVYMVLQPMLLLFSNFLVAVLILIGLVVLNPYVAFGSAVVIGGAYLATYLTLKKSLSAHGKIITDRNKMTQALLSEAFIGIKDVILNSLETKYSSNFKSLNLQGLRSTAFITLSGDIPKFAMETISFGAILILAIIFLLQNETASIIVSTLSIYALAGYKLLPTMQQVYKSISTLSAHGSVPFDLGHELSQASQLKQHTDLPSLNRVERIALKSIEYSYPKSSQVALHNINLFFDLGKINTIAGHSGSGKSTLIDLMLGLLAPVKGNIEVDGKLLEGEFASQYQKSIGYVPQNIFLLDDDVITNVAFGIEKSEIDIDKVNQALTLANAMEFVKDLPQGIHSNLGQDGKMLSGGQRQRIGIARSLYRNSCILILDEPTSALDIESEFEFINLLAELKHKFLIIVISHRPAAIKCSDNITLLEKGQIVANGNMSYLLQTNITFREMIEKGTIQ